MNKIEEAKNIATLLNNKYGYTPHCGSRPSGMVKNEQESLAWGALNSDPLKSWIEIGSFCGSSAVILCEARKSLKAGPTVYSVDRNFEYSTAFNDCVYEIGNFENIHKKILTDSLYLEEKYPGDELSFALIDGWHSFKAAYLDFQIINKYLVKGGYVAFHDTWYQPYTGDMLDQYMNMANNNYELWMSEELPAKNGDKQTYNLDALTAWIINKHNFKYVNNEILDGTNNCLVLIQKQ